MTGREAAPGKEECELAVFGPGYGECIVMHLGGGAWVVVDSCADPDGTPVALTYLDSIGVKPANAVRMAVATHWHDDHIRGLTQILEACPAAQFCVAGALCRREFITLVGALEGQHFSASGSGLRELYRVFSLLRDAGRKPVHAVANRLVHQTDSCRLWALSPSDDVFQRFLSSVGNLVPGVGEDKKRIPSLSPNEAAVVLWVECGGRSVLLGSDMERQGWVAIVEDSVRPAGKASVFKIPHHGSEGADEPAVWEHMLEDGPVAVLTPWRRGRGALPTQRDAERILGATPNAWITDAGRTRYPAFRHGNRTVEKKLREMRERGVRIRRLAGTAGMVRLRWRIGSGDDWKVGTLGAARHLAEYAA